MALRRSWEIVCDVCDKTKIPVGGDILRHPEDQRILMLGHGWIFLEENHRELTVCSHKCLRKYALHPDRFPLPLMEEDL